MFLLIIDIIYGNYTSPGPESLRITRLLTLVPIWSARSILHYTPFAALCNYYW